jgi:hypothetical protein
VSGRISWVASGLAALVLASAPLEIQRATAADATAPCVGAAAIAQLESQARSFAAAGDARQYGLWKEAADAAGRCAQSADAGARGWFTYVHASDAFLGLRGEAEILTGAPPILAELDRLVATEKSASVVAAARGLRDDVARTYRQTRDIMAARATPVPTPEPTISPILLRGRGDPLGFQSGPLGLNFASPPPPRGAGASLTQARRMVTCMRSRSSTSSPGRWR